MAKGGGKSRSRNPSLLKSNGYKHASVDDFVDDDEIDAFHKQRDIVPLDVDDDMEGSEEDDEHSVFDLKSANDDDDDDDKDDDDEDEDEDEDTEDESQVTGLAAKLARTQKNLRATGMGVEDEMHDDSEDEEDKKKLWGRGKGGYYDADNKDYELQSSDEDAALEEKEAERLQREKAKFLYDVGPDESDSEPTLEQMREKKKTAQKAPSEIDSGAAYEVIKKDLNALTKEEQMDAVNSSAPEIVGLLSELNNAVAELDDKINPLLSKVKNMGNIAKGGLHYLEVKQLLLLAYSQAITFYLLLKSEGQQVRDHPVIARLVEIKNLLDKMKQVDENLPSELEDILTRHQMESVTNLPKDISTLTSDPSINAHTRPNGTLEVPVVPDEAAEVVNVNSSQKNEKKRRKSKEMDEHIGIQSKEMLKVRAALEEKLKQKGLFGSITSKHDKLQQHQQLSKGQLMTLSDFDDEAIDKSKGNTNTKLSSKRSQLVTQMQKSKIISGDDDIPMRDDIGERRRKHELRVLAGAGIKYTDNDDNNEDEEESENPSSDEDVDMEEGGEIESEDDFYRTVKEQRAAKLAAKAELYSRTSTVAPVPEKTLEDGKRHISSQMEKNRGLTRPRKKLIKNPRKKYKLAHKKTVIRRKGQVRDIKKPMGPYGGETSGINAGISRSVRF